MKMTLNKSLLFLGLFFVATLLMIPLDASAQCAMCKGAAETNLKQGGGDPQGLNLGILYMLAMPYLIVGSIGYWWWRNRRQEKQVSELQEEDL